MRFASRRPLVASTTRYSATIPTDPKMSPTPLSSRIIVQIRPASLSVPTSRNPTVVSALTAMYSASNGLQPGSMTRYPVVPTRIAPITTASQIRTWVAVMVAGAVSGTALGLDPAATERDDCPDWCRVSSLMRREF